LFWDSTNKRLGINTIPSADLHLANASNLPVIQLDSQAGCSSEIWTFSNTTTISLLRQTLYAAPQTSSIIDLSPDSDDGYISSVRFFRQTNTTGPKYVHFLSGYNNATVHGQIGVDGSDSFFQTSGGNLGIGIDTPATKLDIVGASWDSLIKLTESGSPNSLWINSGSGYASIGYGSSNNDLVVFDSTGIVGVGTNAPDSKLHVYKASAGSVSADGTAVITLESDSSMSLQFLSPATSVQYIFFGDPAGNSTGRITYDHNAGQLSFTIENQAGVIFNNDSGKIDMRLVGQNNDPTTPTLSFGDGDSGFYESTDDFLVISLGGVRQYDIASGSFSAQLGNSWSLRNEVASSTNPTLLPSNNDGDTGIGWAGADQLSIIVGAKEMLRLVETGTSTSDQLIIAPAGIIGTAATPALAFGDGDTGLYELADDILVFANGGVASWTYSANDFRSENASGPTMQNEAASDTNPVFAFRFDLDTGLGHAGADQLSLIAGGIEGMRITENTDITIEADGYINPTTDNTYGLGTPDKRWDSISLGPNSLHMTSKTGDPNQSFEKQFELAIDSITGKLIITDAGTIVAEFDAATGASFPAGGGGGGGDVTKVGTPVDNQLAVWTGDGTLEGEADLIYTASGLAVASSIGIGTTPSTPLHILKTVDGGPVVALMSNNSSVSNSDCYLAIRSTSSFNGQAYVQLGAGGSNYWTINASGTNAGDLLFGAGSTPASGTMMRIDRTAGVLVYNGLSVGHATDPTDDAISIGDTNYMLQLSGTVAIQYWDSGDYTRYDRTNNRLETIIGGSNVTRQVIAGLNVYAGLTVGHSSNPVDDVLSVGDANFQMNFSGSDPKVQFDLNDAIQYNRTANAFVHSIGGGTAMSVGSGGLVDIVGGLSVGHTSAAVDDTISIGDTNFIVNYNSGNPFIQYDSTDYIQYDRTSNYWHWDIGSTQVARLDATGFTLDGDIVTTSGARDWDLIDNTAAALSFDTAGHAGLLVLDTTDNAEQVRIGSTASSSDSNARLIVSLDDTGATTGSNYRAIFAEATAGASYGSVAIEGYARSSSTSGAVGVQGWGIVTNTSDAVQVAGGFFGATATHAGGNNVAVILSASNGAANYAIRNLGGDFINSAAMDWDLVDNTTAALSFDTTGHAGLLVLDTTNDQERVRIGSSANPSWNLKTRLIVSHSSTGLNRSQRQAIFAEAVSDGTTSAYGVVGYGQASGGWPGYGVEGNGRVTNTADVAAAYGGYFTSNQTHAGGNNIGLYASAQGSSVNNYALWIAQGDVYNGNAIVWQLAGYNANALSFDCTTKTGILKLITTNAAEGVSMSGYLLLPQENDAATPTLSFGDGDSGLYESADDTLNIATAGTSQLTIDSTGDVVFSAANGPKIQNETCSDTNPTFSPYGTTNSGLGGSGNRVTLVSNARKTFFAEYFGFAGARVSVDGDTLSNSTTDDKVFDVFATLNGTDAPGGSDTFSAVNVDITTTDITEWDEVNLLRLRDSGIDRFKVDIDGYIGVGTDTDNQWDFHLKHTKHGGATAIFVENPSTAGFSSATLALSCGGTLNGWLSASGGNDIILAADVNNTGKIAFWTQTSSSYTQRMVVQNDGNVGIGSDFPSDKLEVAGNITLNGVLNPSITFDPTAGSTWAAGVFAGNWRVRDVDAAANPFIVNAGAPTNSIRIASNGVGIGTNSPEAKLHVDGDGYFDGYLNPYVDNVYGLGSPDKRWGSISVGPGSLHFITKSTDPGYSENTSFVWTVDQVDKKLKLLDGGTTVAEFDAASGANFPEGGGGGSPGGSDTQLQYNNSGSFGGISGTSWSSPYLDVDNSVQLRPYGAGGSTTVKIGHAASALASNSIAIGATAASDNAGVAIGVSATLTSSTESVAIGPGSRVYNAGDSSIAIGNSATCGTTTTGNADRCIAIGYSAQTANSWYGSIAIGDAASTVSYSCIAIGDAAVVGSANKAIAIGSEATIAASAVGSIAIGDRAYVYNGSLGSIAIGIQAQIGTTTTGNADYAVALGLGAVVGDNATGSLAIGSSATVNTSSTYSIAIGASAGVTTTSYGTAIGYQAAVASGDTNSVALGRSATTTGANQFMLGNASYPLSMFTYGTIAIAEQSTPSASSGFGKITATTDGHCYYLNDATVYSNMSRPTTYASIYGSSIYNFSAVGTNYYLPIFGYTAATTDESQQEMRVAGPGTFINLKIYVTANTRTSYTYFYFRVNNVDRISIGIPAAGTGWFVASGAYSYNDQDRACVRLYSSTGSGTISIKSVGIDAY